MTAPLRVLDLFAGAGGFSLGFQLFRMECGCPAYTLTAVAEVDRNACETLRLNHPTSTSGRWTAVIEGDLTRPEIHRDVMKQVGPGGIDVLIGGPPCQSYSQIGTRTGKWISDERFVNDNRDALFQEYLRLVREFSPVYVVLENVDGIRSKKDASGRPYLSVIIELLEQEGYRFDLDGAGRDRYLKLNAADFGVPQIRQRIFLIGNRLGIPLHPPRPTHHDPSLPEARRPESAVFPWVTLRDAIGDLPPVLALYTKTHLTPEEWKNRQAWNACRFSGLEERSYHRERLERHHRTCGESGRRFLDFVAAPMGWPLRHHRARDQQSSDIELFRLLPPGVTAGEIYLRPELAGLARLIRYDMKSFKDKYRKQSWDRPGTTVFAHLDRDGNRFIHPDSSQARTFTVREAARVQSFPDGYLFAGAMKSRYRQIGNAVPPLLSLAIARAIYCSLQQAGVLEHCCPTIEGESFDLDESR